MRFTDMRGHPLFIPIAGSIVFHLAALVVSLFIFIRDIENITEAITPPFRLESVNPRPGLPLRKGPPGPKELTKELRFAGEKTDAEKQGYPDIPADLLKDKALADRRPVQAETERRILPGPLGPLEDKALSDRILTEAQEKGMKEQVMPVRQKTRQGAASAVKDITARPVSEEGLFEMLKRPLLGLVTGARGNVGLDPEEGMPGFTPAGSGTPWGGGGPFSFGFDEGVRDSTGNVKKYAPLDEFLDIEVFTYTDPSDSSKYFMIAIFARKDAKALEPLPKEMIFTIDASLSTNPERLDEVKKGVKWCLERLNPGDVFNIAAFKARAFFFRPESVEATPANIAAAERFVAELTSDQRTDVYGVFSEIIGKPAARRPSYVMLISDGRPTHGVVNSREVIKAITRLNQRTRPVFSFSGGKRVNRYLLDFIAYQNRGWSEYIKKTPDIDAGLAAFYKKLKDPIFLNLRYRLNGLDESEVFPQSLPDFYRGAEFTLFGKYEKEDTFSMQLLGDTEGQTRELIFSRALSEAKPGTADVMKGWAFNKIYDRISRITNQGPDPSLQAEVKALSARYVIATPYSEDIERID
ncbi:MAG: hypothetical protein A3D28_00240 [Omnitrophica bacterium RIFCSPHIGHO2_02_FULL_63_14]|nr:MAG: hypothetical protein A3D28_00240 [Omnitrophica bacterium RIFCSPHIGHO2_02_FULL_63_14]